MYEKEEEKLKNMYDNIQVPQDSLDEAIFTGVQKASMEKRRSSRRKKWLFTMVAAAILFIGFLTSIRISPAFADYITVIPGMEKLVNLIRDDKGKLLAVENDYYEKIGVSQEKNGLTLTIDGAISDENGLVLFYTIHSKEKQKELSTANARLTSLDGEKPDFAFISSGGPLNSPEGETSHSDVFEFFFQSPFASKKLELKVNVGGQKIKEEFSLEFELKKEIQKKKSYVLNKTVSVEGQRISFIQADIYPLRAAIHVKMDPNNTKKLLNFDDLRLVDEKGETWNKIKNGITASQISDDEAIIYLQSNYFHKPKELYLVFNKIQAVDKDEAKVVVDTGNKQILKQPKGNHFRSMKVEGDDLKFNFHTKSEFNYFLFNNITDGNGKTLFSQTGYSGGWEDDGMVEIGVNIPDLKNQTNPISLEITYFPSWIKGDYKIKIK